MKNFKEKILKIGKRKNCFIALLLVALIAFGIVTGLKGSNSADTGLIKANAFNEAPQPKNLDLNGIRYTYQTSLKDLKSEYGFFVHPLTLDWFSIINNSEGETLITNYGLTENSDTVFSEELKTQYLNTLNSSIKLYFNNDTNPSEEQITGFDNNLGDNYYVQSEWTNVDNFDNLTDIEINFNEFKKMPRFNESYNGDVLMTFVYVPNDANLTDLNSSFDKLSTKCIYYNVLLSNQIKYKFNIKPINGYTVRNILCSSENNSVIETDNYITINFMNGVVDSTYYETNTCSATIENLNFILNNDANIIDFNTHFKNTRDILYKGNILLSQNKYDFSFVNDIANGDGYGAVTIDGDLFWGGNFNNKKPSFSSNGSIVFYVGRNTASFDTWYTTVYSSHGPMQPYGNGFGSITYISNELYGSSTSGYGISYEEQSRLIYLSEINTLQGTYNDTDYDALSTQVEDILYNVQYVGNIEENERNERIEEDFNNLLKTVGLGAFIGLLIGILIGNPALGLIWGAFIGLAVGILPLLIDGLQAIFGKDFLSGLYDFFKRITQFFVNIVDTIIEFLMNIITNPFILILIVIIAIIYIVKRYNK